MTPAKVSLAAAFGYYNVIYDGYKTAHRSAVPPACWTDSPSRTPCWERWGPSKAPTSPGGRAVCDNRLARSRTLLLLAQQSGAPVELRHALKGKQPTTSRRPVLWWSSMTAPHTGTLLLRTHRLKRKCFYEVLQTVSSCTDNMSPHSAICYGDWSNSNVLASLLYFKWIGMFVDMFEPLFWFIFL